MCIIMYQKAGDSRLEQSAFERSERINSDGMGIAYPEDGELITYRTMDDLGGLMSRYSWARNREKPVLVHFRLATQGVLSEENCQPFKVHDNLVMAHNGNIRFTSLPEGWSDSRYFGDAILSDLSPDILNNPAVFHLLEYYIGSGNKVAIMDVEGNATILNEDSGHWRDDTWFSNYSYSPYGTKTKSLFFNKDDEEGEDEYEVIEVEDGDLIEEGCLYKGKIVCYGCLPENVDDRDLFDLYEANIPQYCEYCSFWLSSKNPHVVAQRNRAEA